MFLIHFIDQLATLNGLVKLQVDKNDVLMVRFGLGLGKMDRLGLSALKSLEEIYVKNCDITDLPALSNELTNLKCIRFDSASIEDIMLLIEQSSELQKIKIEIIQHGMHFSRDTNVIDLLAMNKEREKLPSAQKVTLYVDEAIYLATKWAMKGTDFGLIQVKRFLSFEWDSDF